VVCRRDLARLPRLFHQMRIGRTAAIALTNSQHSAGDLGCTLLA
jgi:hypothetical protein